MPTRDDQNYYYIKDWLHSVYALMDGVDGQKPITYAYSPYGQVSITRGDSTSSYNWNPFLYTGREAFNAALSIYNYRSRHYFASFARFSQPDSFPGFLTRPASLNKYMYVEGGPINATDPWGWATLSNNPKRGGFVFGGIFLGGGAGYLITLGSTNPYTVIIVVVGLALVGGATGSAADTGQEAAEGAGASTHNGNSTNSGTNETGYNGSDGDHNWSEGGYFTVS